MHHRSLHYSVVTYDNPEENSVRIASNAVYTSAPQHEQQPKDRARASQDSGDLVSSETPSDLNPHTVTTQEAPDSQKPKSKPTNISVNTIGSIHDTKPGRLARS